jgi:hypothetical protein
MAQRRPEPGNGSSQIPIHQDDMGGWVRVHTDPTTVRPAHFGLFLSSALMEWFRQRPQLRMRCVVPVTQDGDTVELHAWYDLGVFPATGGPQPSK